VGSHLIRLQDGELVATNQYSLVKFETDSKLEVPLSIPMNAIKVLEKVLVEQKTGTVDFYSENDKLKIVSVNYTIITKLVDLPFVDYKRVIENAYSKITTRVNRKELIEALKKHETINKSNELGKYSSIFTITASAMQIHSINPATQIKDTIACESDGEIKISLNTKIILSFLKGLKCESVQLKFNDSRSAVVIVPELENGLLLTMPLAIREVD
jgi:DNA polymerase III sliding clamp (beta) subunit (PCNA family)